MRPSRALTAVPTGDALKNVLLYHVASGKVEAGDLATGDNVVNSLLTGETFTVNVGSAGVTITDANDNTFNVTLTDVQAERGAFHVIHGAILPTP